MDVQGPRAKGQAARTARGHAETPAVKISPSGSRLHSLMVLVVTDSLGLSTYTIL